MILVIGLGNPGKEFKNTRHNVGFDVIDAVQKVLLFQSFQKNLTVSILKKLYAIMK